MKKIKAYLYLLVLAMFFQACDGINLEEGLDPINSIPANGAINNIKSATAAVIGIYDALQANHTDGMLFLAQIYSDEAVFTGTFPTRFEFNNLNVQTSNSTNDGVFTNFYVVINNANNVIELLPEVDDPGLTPEVVNSFLGEARMARALSYFYLTEYYGDVPLILTPTREVTAEALNVPNSRQADVYTQIIDDLKFAESNITQTNTKRFTSQAASAMLARAYLYQQDWSNALAQAQKALGTDFDLSDYAYLTDEIMYLGFTTADGNVLNFWYGPAELGGRHDVEPSAKYMAAFEEGDTRAAMSFDNSLTRATVPFCVKYDDFSAGISGTGTDPVMLFRYAEQLLIAAEAAAEMGDFTAASGYINQVRARAGLGDVTLTADNYVDMILHERMVELGLEGPHRYFDLRRRGKAADEIPGYQTCNDIWPIPQRDIDRNPNLEQNGCCNC
ncbi:MAG: RagB/SusD family nutrient uptake outer membrane protein [Saprospiraceae bacterium]|nr:RagB/SusD family nutrient uptake outer membrane protein [Lewinella sp.]